MFTNNSVEALYIEENKKWFIDPRAKVCARGGNYYTLDSEKMVKKEKSYKLRNITKWSETLFEIKQNRNKENSSTASDEEEEEERDNDNYICHLQRQSISKHIK